MGILSRFKEIMRVNVNALLERTEDPAKTVDDYMRTLSSDLGQVKAETTSVLADEQRAKRALDECGAEVKKLQRYAEKAAEAGEEENARKFLERKAALQEKLSQLQAAYDQAAVNAANMKQMQEKLAADLSGLEARHAELKGKMAAAKIQQGLNDGSSAASGAGAAFAVMEEQANRALDEATALAELRAGTKEEDLDVLMDRLEKDMEQAKQQRAKTDES